MVVVRLLIYFAFIAVSSNYVDSRIIRIKKPETPTFDFSKYHGFPQFEQYLRNVASMNPAFVELREIGKTHQGRSLLGVKIGYPASSISKRAVWFDGGNHAREWPAFHTALYFVDQLVQNYGKDAQITNFINRLNIYIFPVLNPDGFVYTRSSRSALIRLWRKNRGPPNCGGRSPSKTMMCCEGVDLNRNYDIDFGVRKYPFNNSCSDEYQGPFAFSEPESRAVRDAVTSFEVRGKLGALVSMHTHGQLFILPFNFARHTYSEDNEDLKILAEKAAEAIKASRGTEYQIGTAADLVGPSTGGATDWIKKNTDIKYVYVLELPPDLKESFAFQCRPHWLIPIANETWAGMRVIMEEVLSMKLTKPKKTVP